MPRPDPIYWVIYIYVLAAATYFVWDFLPTRRAPKTRGKDRGKQVATRTKR